MPTNYGESTRELQENDTQKRVNSRTHGNVKKPTCVSFSDKMNEIALYKIKTPANGTGIRVIIDDL